MFSEGVIITKTRKKDNTKRKARRMTIRLLNSLRGHNVHNGESERPTRSSLVALFRVFVVSCFRDEVFSALCQNEGSAVTS